MKKYPTHDKPRNVQDNLAAADDLAVAILQERIANASKGRQLQEQPLSLREVERLRQHGTLN